MLSISNVTPQQGAEYFKEENYYSKEEAQEQSKWFGVSAASLGLSGNVDGEQFKNLLNGYSPDGKKVLSGKKIDPENRRAGFDMTFSAPKSISLAALYGGDKNLELAHYTAVDRALRIYEQQYAQARVWDGKQQQKVNTGNIVAAQFHHTTSREKDPQLHTHCIVLNCTQLENGKWRALTNEELYNNEMLLGAIYRNELACEARKLGYETENRPDGLFEIKGYTQFQLEWFSKRRQQIVELVGENATAQEKDWAALQTRAPKGKELPRAEQLGWWQAQNEAFNLQIQHPIPQPIIPTTVGDRIVTQTERDERSAAAAVKDAIEHCSERTVEFKRKTLEKFIFSEIKSFSYAELEKAIANDPELIAIFDGGFTTQTAINRELATIKLMQQGKSAVESIADNEMIALHLAQKTLTQGQHEAIALALTTTDSLIGWQGVAGAGKTYALNEFRAIAQEGGYSIKGFAPSSEAAKVLGEEVGIESNTVASLLVSKQKENTDSKQIWIVDEAGLLSAKDAHNLLLLATNQKARVIFVGDTKQLSAVEAGNPFKSLQSAGMQTAYLNQSLRQRVKDLQESVDFVAAGRADLGISKLDAAGRIAVIPDAEERLAMLVKDYMALSTEERVKTLVLAGTNSDRALITDSIRQKLKDVGLLGEAAMLTQLKAKDLTQVQARYSHHYAVGDVVVPTRDYKRLGLNKFQPYIVEALNKNSLTLKAIDGTECVVDPMAFRKTVYNQQSVEIAVGDRLKWTRNDRQLGRRNGQEFVVTAINGSRAQTMYSNSKTDEVDLDQLQHLDYALVSTTYSSQGKTADRVLIAADKTIGKESFYVAVSRAKYDLKIYTEDKKNLLKLAQKSRAKKTALELVNSEAATSQSAIIDQLPTTTNKETTHERTIEPTQPASNSQQFEPGDGDIIGRSVSERLNAHSRKTRPNRRLDDSSTPSKPRAVELRPRAYQPRTSQPAARVDLNLQGIERVSNQWRDVSKLITPATTRQKSGSFNADGGQTVLRATFTQRATATRNPNPRLQGISNKLNVQLRDLESTIEKFVLQGTRASSTASDTERTSPSAESNQSNTKPTVRRVRSANIQLEPELQQISDDTNALVKRLGADSGVDATVENAGSTTPETSNVARQTDQQFELQLPRTDQTRAALSEFESQLQQISDDTNALVGRLESNNRVDGKPETGSGERSRINTAAPPTDRQQSTEFQQFASNVNAFIRKSSSVSASIINSLYHIERLKDLSLDSQFVNNQNSNLEQEQITHDINPGQSSSERSNYEQDSLIDRENWAVGNKPQSLDRTNPTARKNSDRELEPVAIKLPELLEAISRYLDLQEVEQLGVNIAELNRSLANGGLRGQGTASFSNRTDGQNPTAIDNATSGGSIKQRSTEAEPQFLNTIANPAVEAIKERFEVEVIESKKIVQDLEELTSSFNLRQEQEFKETVQKLNLALPSLIKQLNQQVTSALEQQATEAISKHIEVETCELTLASQNLPLLSRQLAKLQHQKLTEAMRQLADTVEAVSFLTTQHLSNQTIEAIAKYIDSSAVDLVISEPSSKLTQYLAGQATLLPSIKQLDAIISDYLAQVKTEIFRLEQSRQEQAILALSNYVEHSAVDSALGESLFSFEEQLSQYQKQLASNLTNSNLKALLVYLESIGKPDKIEPLAKTQILASKSNISTNGQLPSKNEQQWAQIRQYLIERRCLPARLVDGMYAAGKLSADSSGRAVFLQSNSQGQVTGVKSLDIKDGRYISKSQPIPGATGGIGYFQLTQGKGKLSRIVLTTSPIEAMSLAALEKGQYKNRTIYIDVNKQPDIPKLQELINSSTRVEVAFGADEASVVKAQQIISSFPGATRRKLPGERTWNEQLRQSHQTSRKTIEPKSQQKFDPKQQLLKAIKSDRQVFKSASEADLKVAIKGLVAGRSLEQISQDIASSSGLVKHWETRERPSTQAIAKTIKYVEQLYQEAQSEPAYYQQLYHKYLKEAQKNNPYLSRAELDRAVASVALRSHPQESVKSMLKYSLAAQVGSDEYVEQTLAVVSRQQAQLAQEARQKTCDYQSQNFEYED